MSDHESADEQVMRIANECCAEVGNRYLDSSMAIKLVRRLRAEQGKYDIPLCDAHTASWFTERNHLHEGMKSKCVVCAHIAEQGKQEPVAWRCQLLKGGKWFYFMTHPDLADDSPWETVVPLSREELQQEITAMVKDRASLNAMATLLAKARATPTPDALLAAELRGMEWTAEMCDRIGVDWRDAGDMTKFYATNYLVEAIRAEIKRREGK